MAVHVHASPYLRFPAWLVFFSLEPTNDQISSHWMLAPDLRIHAIPIGVAGFANLQQQRITVFFAAPVTRHVLGNAVAFALGRCDVAALAASCPVRSFLTPRITF